MKIGSNFNMSFKGNVRIGKDDKMRDNIAKAIIASSNFDDTEADKKIEILKESAEKLAAETPKGENYYLNYFLYGNDFINYAYHKVSEIHQETGSDDKTIARTNLNNNSSNKLYSELFKWSFDKTMEKAKENPGNYGPITYSKGNCNEPEPKDFPEVNYAKDRVKQKLDEINFSE